MNVDFLCRKHFLIRPFDKSNRAAKGAGGLPRLVLKRPCKIGGRGKAQGFANLAYGHFCFGQQLSRLKKAAVLQQFNRRAPRGCATAARQMRGRDTQFRRQFGNTDATAKLLFHHIRKPRNQAMRSTWPHNFGGRLQNLAF